ncbi:hypothetical protein J1N35_004793 [Gossypium stocksii]|uniref:Zinc knuckle CX2CX4HX4C domain-containing protein n=1 Tax=Gossypium stocksii TaxID=47602 RepID=A0A9D3WDE8_9ROSI|nr:hypothetical protein J1N35_004793 [Gossypium stocksii]
MNTDNKARGSFARMAVYVNLDRPLVFQILINGRIQKVEYEFLPMVCFQCGRYGHVKKLASLGHPNPSLERNHHHLKFHQKIITRPSMAQVRKEIHTSCGC